MITFSQFDIVIYLILFLLLQLDPYLTIVGYSMYKKYYARFITLESYELNPLWRKTVEKGSIFNLRRFLITILLLLLIFLLSSLNESIGKVVIGSAFFLYITLNFRHFQNIFLFHYLKDHPQDLEGNVKFNLAFTLQQSYLNYLSTFLLLLVITIITLNLYLFGGTLVFFFLLIFFKLLQFRARKKSVSA